MHGDYDAFIDWMFYKERPEPTYLADAISEMEGWACFKRKDRNPKKDGAIAGKFFEDMKNSFEKYKQAAPKKAKIGRNDPCPCGSGKKYKKCCLDKDQKAQNGSSIARVEDIYDLLEMYPKDSPLFEQMYEKEAVSIDKLVYKALRHRSIPIWEQRDYEQEKLGKIDYLNEALSLFLDKCGREQITSFAAYDKQYMIHYKSREWVSAMIELTEDNDTAGVKVVRQKAMDTLQSLS
jgi:hypothetical protein